MFIFYIYDTNIINVKLKILLHKVYKKIKTTFPYKTFKKIVILFIN
jgi:hypothetical protein